MTGHHCPINWHYKPSRYCAERHGCECQGCKDDRRRYHREYQRKHRYGGGGREQCDGTQALVNWMLDKNGGGLTQQDIAEGAGVSSSTVSRIARGVTSGGGERAAYLRTRRAIEQLARKVGSGELVPPGYQEAQERRLVRERRRVYRERAKAAEAASGEGRTTVEVAHADLLAD